MDGNNNQSINFGKIENLAKERGIPIARVLSRAEVYTSGYYTARKTGDMRLSTLKRIARTLQVDYIDLLIPGNIRGALGFAL